MGLAVAGTKSDRPLITDARSENCEKKRNGRSARSEHDDMTSIRGPDGHYFADIAPLKIADLFAERHHRFRLCGPAHLLAAMPAVAVLARCCSSFAVTVCGVTCPSGAVRPPLTTFRRPRSMCARPGASISGRSRRSDTLR